MTARPQTADRRPPLPLRKNGVVAHSLHLQQVDLPSPDPRRPACATRRAIQLSFLLNLQHGLEEQVGCEPANLRVAALCGAFLADICRPSILAICSIRTRWFLVVRLSHFLSFYLSVFPSFCLSVFLPSECLSVSCSLLLSLCLRLHLPFAFCLSPLPVAFASCATRPTARSHPSSPRQRLGVSSPPYARPTTGLTTFSPSQRRQSVRSRALSRSSRLSVRSSVAPSNLPIPPESVPTTNRHCSRAHFSIRCRLLMD